MEIIKGSSKNPVVDELLVDFFAKNHPEMDATLYSILHRSLDLTELFNR